MEPRKNVMVTVHATQRQVTVCVIEDMVVSIVPSGAVRCPLETTCRCCKNAMERDAAMWALVDVCVTVSSIMAMHVI